MNGIKAFGYYNSGAGLHGGVPHLRRPKIHDNLVADLSAAVSSVAHNQADDSVNEIGPLISKHQRDRAASFVERAAELPHIKIATGGHIFGEGGLQRADGGGRGAPVR